MVDARSSTHIAAAWPNQEDHPIAPPPGEHRSGPETMIDIRKLKELVRLMVENDLAELDLQDQQETVTIKRGAGVPAGVPVVHHAPTIAATPANGQPDAATAGGSTPVAVDEDSDLVAVESPMVGTFYSAPNPDSPPFVDVGKNVSADTTVCLIEAMKVFNEIKAEVNGTIEKILVENGQAVEYGQRLFLVRPS